MTATVLVAVGAGSAKPDDGQQWSARCARQVVVWDSYDHQRQRGLWHHGGLCGGWPAPHTVREHCTSCGWSSSGQWCTACVCANLDELAQQGQTGYAEALLWCLKCEQFSVQLEVIA